MKKEEMKLEVTQKTWTSWVNWVPLIRGGYDMIHQAFAIGYVQGKIDSSDHVVPRKLLVKWLREGLALAEERFTDPVIMKNGRRTAGWLHAAAEWADKKVAGGNR